MATTTGKRGGATTRTSDAVVADTNTVWRIRCQALEERLQDATAALRVSEQERRELSLDYRHCLHRLWALNARLGTHRGR